MRIRTIIGATMAEAMTQVREELGPDAVIIHIEDTKSRKGVMIRAAAESPDLPSQGATHPSTDPTSHLADMETRIESQLRSRLRTMRRLPATFAPIDPQVAIAPALAFHKVPAELAARIVAFASEAEAQDDCDALAHGLERTMAFGPIPPWPARPLMVLGASGHGKTAIIARLAVRAATEGASVTMITLDTGKAGAVSQIETYANLLKAKVEIAENETDLKAAVDRHKSNGVILIDTPGANIWLPDEVAQTRQWIDASGAEPLWVCSAEGDADDMAETAKAYASLGVRRAIITKLDAVRRFGGMLNLAHAGPVALSHTTSSPFLANGLEIPEPSSVALAMLNAYFAFIGTNPSTTKISSEKKAKCA